jgi:hypothetical protein
MPSAQDCKVYVSAHVMAYPVAVPTGAPIDIGKPGSYLAIATLDARNPGQCLTTDSSNIWARVQPCNKNSAHHKFEANKDLATHAYTLATASASLVGDICPTARAHNEGCPMQQHAWQHLYNRQPLAAYRALLLWSAWRLESERFAFGLVFQQSSASNQHFTLGAPLPIQQWHQVVVQYTNKPDLLQEA